MGYKQWTTTSPLLIYLSLTPWNITALLKGWKKINAIINWPRIESLLLKHYTVW